MCDKQSLEYLAKGNQTGGKGGRGEKSRGDSPCLVALAPNPSVPRSREKSDFSLAHLGFPQRKCARDRLFGVYQTNQVRRLQVCLKHSKICRHTVRELTYSRSLRTSTLSLWEMLCQNLISESISGQPARGRSARPWSTGHTGLCSPSRTPLA
jgi:hypothetical protein